jgi:hypothetical protein
MHYNPEKRAWRGRSYKNGKRVRDLRDGASRDAALSDAPELPELTEADLDEWAARMEERADGVHKDSLFW